jgi:SAM-dependent methyltransferase
MGGQPRKIAAALLPANLRRWLRSQQQRLRLHWPPAGAVQFGDFRRLRPISRVFGLDRGLPVDRFYIEQFLDSHASDIRGRVLEMGDDLYTRKFGGERVTQGEVLHVVEGQPGVTIVADLSNADHLPSDTFDCIIFTQTLQMIYDFRAALGTLHRILAPAGVLLATFHGISRIGRREGVDPWGEYWRFTEQSARRLFQEFFPPAGVKVETRGNVLVATAFLHGLAAEELNADELDYTDPDYEVLVTVRAVKPASGSDPRQPR